MNLIKYFRNIRERVQPNRKWCVVIGVWNEFSKKYNGQMPFTTHARTRKEAENRIKDNIRLHITDAFVVKEHLNGSKK